MPAYREPVVRKPKAKKATASGAAAAINAAVKTATHAAAKAPAPKAKVRVKAKPVGVFARPAVIGDHPLKHAQHVTRAKVVKTAAKLPADHRTKIYPVKSTYTPKQARAIIKGQTNALKIGSPYYQGGSSKPKYDLKGQKPGELAQRKLTAPDKTTRTQLDLLQRVSRATAKQDHAVSLAGISPEHRGQATSGRHHGPIKKVEQASIGAGFEKVARQVHSVAPDAGATALNALHIAGIPNNVIAGATLGESPKEAIKKGTTFSDVLDKAGVHNKIVKGVGGFVLDVAWDPTTYATAGLSSVGRKAVEVAAKDAYKRALVKGLTEEQAQGFARRAASQAAKIHKPGKTIDVGFGKKRVPILTVGKKRGEKNPGVLSEVGERVSPRYVHPHADEQAQVTVRRANARKRASVGRAEAKYVQRGRAFATTLKPSEQQRINDALEGYTLKTVNGEQKLARYGIKDLPDHLREAAIRQRSDYRYERRVKAAAGAGGKDVARGAKPGEAQGYVARVRRQDVSPGFVKKGKGVSSKGVADSARGDRRPLAIKRAEDPSLFTEDPGVAYAVKNIDAEKGAAQARANRALASTGRPLKGDPYIDTGREGIYHIPAAGGKPRELVHDSKVHTSEIHAALRTPQERLAAQARLKTAGRDLATSRKILKATTTKSGRKAWQARVAKLEDTVKTARDETTLPQPGQYVVLNKKVVEDHLTRGVGEKPGGKIARKYDAVTGVWKTLATVVRPAFHARNFVGDNFNAWLEQNSAKLTGNLARGVRANKAVHGIREADASISVKPTNRLSSAGTKIRGKHETYDDLAERFLATGAGDAGFHGGDVPDLLKQSRGAKGPVEKLRRASQARENVTRFATFVHGLKQGLSDDAAADLSRELHFDYGDLTATERKLRRVAPFYTFTARNTPLQARKLVTRPGKYATVEKAREELAKGIGLDTSDKHDYERQLKDFDRRAVPFPAPFKAAGLPVMLQAGLPLNDLQRLTVPTSFKGLKGAAVDQASQIAAAITFYKTAFELPANYSAFFHDKIDQGSLVAAPSWAPEAAKHVPGAMKELGLTKQIDKKSGKTIWKWKAKYDYLFKQVPEGSFLLNQTTPAKNRKGQDRALQLAGSVGVRPVPFDAIENKIQRTYGAITSLENKRKRTNPGSADRKRINGKIAQLDRQLTDLSVRAGYKVPLGQAAASARARGGKLPTNKKAASSNPFDGPGHTTGHNPFDGPSSGSSAPNPFDGG